MEQAPEFFNNIAACVGPENLTVVRAWRHNVAQGNEDDYLACVDIVTASRTACLLEQSQVFDALASRRRRTIIKPPNPDMISGIIGLARDSLAETVSLGQQLAREEIWTPDYEPWLANERMPALTADEQTIITRYRRSAQRSEIPPLNPMLRANPNSRLRLFESAVKISEIYDDNARHYLAAIALAEVIKLSNHPDFIAFARQHIQSWWNTHEQIRTGSTQQALPQRRELSTTVLDLVSEATKQPWQLITQSQMGTLKLVGLQYENGLASQTERAKQTDPVRTELSKTIGQLMLTSMENAVAEADLWTTRLAQLPQEYQTLLERWHTSKHQLDQAGLRPSYVELDNTLGEPTGRQTIGLVWLVRAAIKQEGIFWTQKALRRDLDQEEITYWLADLLMQHLPADYHPAQSLPEKPTLAELVQTTRENWSSIFRVIKAHAKPESQTSARLGEIYQVLFSKEVRRIEPSTTERTPPPDIKHLEAAETIRTILRAEAMDLFQEVGQVDFRILAHTDEPAVEPSVPRKKAEPTGELEVSKIDRGRFTIIRALKYGVANTEWVTEKIFSLSATALPYIGIILPLAPETKQHPARHIIVAENLVVRNATYVYAEGPGKASWEDVLASNRHEARVLHGALQLWHSRSGTTADHMERIIDALVEVGLPRHIAAGASDAFHNMTARAGDVVVHGS